ncbi:MAG: S49 family peptidase [Dehalococcoidia bacterium]
MDRLGIVWRLLFPWYISGVLLAAAGILIGYVIFFHIFPGKPEIGIINIPGTRITDRTASTIGEFLDFARDEDSIKAVVIKMSSGGGGAAASEKLFLKTVELRGKKPVVVVVQGVTASGAYMWSMGANYVYAKPTSLIGSVGAVFQLPSLPRPDEDIVFTGPAKRTGAPKRTFVEILEMVKESFLDIVMSQRGDKLQISREELAQARLYPGMEAVRLGLADEIGSDIDAIKKAAGLAGVSNYDLVDVNAEVLRLFIQKLKRIFDISVTDDPAQMATQVESLTEFLSTWPGVASGEEDLPGLPNEIDLPQFYYYYVPPSE